MGEDAVISRKRLPLILGPAIKLLGDSFCVS